MVDAKFKFSQRRRAVCLPVSDDVSGRRHISTVNLPSPHSTCYKTRSCEMTSQNRRHTMACYRMHNCSRSGNESELDDVDRYSSQLHRT